MRCAFPETSGVTDCPPEIEPFRKTSGDFTCERCCYGVLKDLPTLFVMAKAPEIYTKSLRSQTALDRAVEKDLRENRRVAIEWMDDYYPEVKTFNIWNLLE